MASPTVIPLTKMTGHAKPNIHGIKRNIQRLTLHNAHDIILGIAFNRYNGQPHDSQSASSLFSQQKINLKPSTGQFVSIKSS